MAVRPTPEASRASVPSAEGYCCYQRDPACMPRIRDSVFRGLDPRLSARQGRKGEGAVTLVRL
jgi:hypothetical protein